VPAPAPDERSPGGDERQRERSPTDQAGRQVTRLDDTERHPTTHASGHEACLTRGADPPPAPSAPLRWRGRAARYRPSGVHSPRLSRSEPPLRPPLPTPLVSEDSLAPRPSGPLWPPRVWLCVVPGLAPTGDGGRGPGGADAARAGRPEGTRGVRAWSRRNVVSAQRGVRATWCPRNVVSAQRPAKREVPRVLREAGTPGKKSWSQSRPRAEI
jgi:hypothetical protein